MTSMVSPPMLANAMMDDFSISFQRMLVALTISWQIWICFALVYLIAGGAFVAGALVAFAWHLFVHHCAHHGPDKLPLPLLKHHQSHHRFASRNYGVSTTLWDHVFGTMLR
jgi:sterol desaturase/sphingolipid hydroxylase (fatty acid hydroxylase superfamily)